MEKTDGEARRDRVRKIITVFSVVSVTLLLYWILVLHHNQGTRKNMVLIRLVVGPLQVNCFILADEKTKDAVVIDPGDDAADILKIIKGKDFKVRYIVNTHGHFDHVGANKAVRDATGAKILMHEADAPLLADAVDQAIVFGMRVTNPPRPDRFVGDGDVITAGEVSLKVLHTPGHSPGGISLLEQGMVFTGDALFAGSIGRTDFPDGDLMTLIRGIKKKLLTLPDDTRVFAGHGPASTIGEERRDNPFLNKESGFE